MTGQIFAIAIGGASGAVLRFLLSNSIYNWLGRGFPYGTLTVNVIGSLLMGLLTSALVVEKIALSSEYRVALLVGFLGSLTTFSTFSLETVYLIEQGHWTKATANIFISLFSCLLTVWIGLLTGKVLFSHGNGFFYWHDWPLPYALITVNLLIALLTGLIASLLCYHLVLSVEYQAAIILIIIGLFLTFSNLYLLLHLLTAGYHFETHCKQIASLLLINVSLCCLLLSLGWFTGNQILH